MTTEEVEKQNLADIKMCMEITKYLANIRHVTIMTFIVPFATAAGIMAVTATLVIAFA